MQLALKGLSPSQIHRSVVLEFGLKVSDRSVRRRLSWWDAPQSTRARASQVKLAPPPSDSMVSELKAHVRALQNRQGLEDRIAAEVRLAASQIGYTPVSYVPPSSPKTMEPHEMVLVISDAHYGEPVNPAEVPAGWAYDMDICERRMEEIFRRTIAMGEAKGYPIQKLHIAVIGDMLSGDIHEELARTNLDVMASLSIKMGQILYRMGQRFCAHFPEVHMFVIPGNHSRIMRKPNQKQKNKDNWEYTMGLHIEAMQRDFTMDLPLTPHYFYEVFDKLICFEHGDNQGGGLSPASLTKRIDGAREMALADKGRIHDYHVMGHYHRHLVHTHGHTELIINGAIKGPDEFSTNRLAALNPPEQTILIFHPKQGLVATERIYLKGVM